ncbi:MAG: hypothetical protein ACYC2H_01760 [Thermoplasmatota archaeon]
MRPILLALFGAALFLAPSATAIDYAFGSAVSSSDYDFSPMAETTKLALCFMDYNGDGLHAAGEPILLLFKVATAGVCPATLSNNALLLNAMDGRTVGMEITMADKWASKAIVPFPANFIRYFEDGSDASKLDSKDSVYLDLKNTALPRVDVGDLRLSKGGAFASGTLVGAGDSDLNFPLTDIKGTPRTVSSSSIIYKAGSAYYINADAGTIGGAVDGTCALAACPVTGDFGVESGDLRLNPKAVNPLSDKALVLVDGLKLSASDLRPDEPFRLSVLVKNTGKGFGAGLVKTSIDGIAMDARATPTLYSNEVATLVVGLTAPSEPGRYKVTAGDYSMFIDVEGQPFGATTHDLEARIAALESQLAGSPGQAGTPATASVGAPSPMPVLVLAALFGVVLFLRRRTA